MKDDTWLNAIGMPEAELLAALRGDRYLVGIILSREQASDHATYMASVAKVGGDHSRVIVGEAVETAATT